MISEQQSVKSKAFPEHVYATEQARDLANIADPRWNLAVWDRRLSPELEKAVYDPRFDRPLNLRCRLHRTQYKTQIADITGKAELEHQTSSDALSSDLCMLAETFFEFCGQDEVRMSLDRVADGMCRKFHVDFYHLRLICTYRGAGTEWLSEEDVDRARGNHEAEDYQLERKNAYIRRLRAGQVGIMKGENFPAAAGRGLVHRSPQPDGFAQTRVLVRFDC